MSECLLPLNNDKLIHFIDLIHFYASVVMLFLFDKLWNIGINICNSFLIKLICEEADSLPLFVRMWPPPSMGQLKRCHNPIIIDCTSIAFNFQSQSQKNVYFSHFKHNIMR